MKVKLFALALVSVFGLQPLAWLRAATTIDPANRYAYAANLGWLDCRGDTNNGVVISEYVCSGYLYAANAGWINLGSGAPTNGIQYQNLSAGDFGVNHDGLGNLRGYAYGANIGWINFESTGAPKVNLWTGNLSGYVYSANCGWISLSNSTACVRTTSIATGALSTNGLPVAWLLTCFGATNVNPNADPDNDGQSNAREYRAGTNPNDGADVLRITHIERGVPPHGPTYVILEWNAKPTRFYAVQRCPALGAAASWTEFGAFSWPGVDNVGFNQDGSQYFYRLRAYRPLMP